MSILIYFPYNKKIKTVIMISELHILRNILVYEYLFRRYQNNDSFEYSFNYKIIQKLIATYVKDNR